MASKSEKAIAGVLIGAAIGAAIYYAFKEKSPKDKFKKGYREAQGELADAFDEMSKKAKSKFGKSKRSLNTAYDDLVKNGKGAKEDIVRILEDKLKDIKHTVHTATK